MKQCILCGSTEHNTPACPLRVVKAELTVAEWVAITLGILQALYLLRKWWREETEAGLRMKRWAQKHGLSKPAPLEPLEPLEVDE